MTLKKYVGVCVCTCVHTKKKGRFYDTMTTASLAASARISAHETVCGQNSSSSLLAASMTSNPPRDLFAGSALSVPSPSTSTDASHPCKNIAIILYP